MRIEAVLFGTFLFRCLLPTWCHTVKVAFRNWSSASWFFWQVSGLKILSLRDFTGAIFQPDFAVVDFCFVNSGAHIFSDVIVVIHCFFRLNVFILCEVCLFVFYRFQRFWMHGRIGLSLLLACFWRCIGFHVGVLFLFPLTVNLFVLSHSCDKLPNPPTNPFLW